MLAKKTDLDYSDLKDAEEQYVKNQTTNQTTSQNENHETSDDDISEDSYVGMHGSED